MLVKAELKNYRQSPRKVRLVADLIRGKKVDRALVELKYLDKKASLVLGKLLDSAVANAKHNFNIAKKDLFIKEIRVDEGITLKRWRAGARGRAYPLKKRTSRVFVSLSDEQDIKEVKVEREKKARSSKEEPKAKEAKAKTEANKK